MWAFAAQMIWFGRTPSSRIKLVAPVSQPNGSLDAETTLFCDPGFVTACPQLDAKSKMQQPLSGESCKFLAQLSMNACTILSATFSFPASSQPAQVLLTARIFKGGEFSWQRKRNPAVGSTAPAPARA